MRKKNVEPVKSETAKSLIKNLIYCGPDIPGIAKQFSIFKDGISEPLKKHIEKCSAIQKLLVSPEKLQETRSKINVSGTAEHVFYLKIIDYRKELNS